jgi:putative nucleotidyltransferase-like protein
MPPPVPNDARHNSAAGVFADPHVHRTTWLRHLAARAVVSQVGSELAAASIPFVLVKGIVTAHALYDDPAARPIGDVDLRITPRYFSRAVRLARARGWYARPDMIRWQALWKVDGWEVDVKAALGPPGLCTISVEDVLRRAERHVEPFGFVHLWPELNDHALILVLNAFKDGLRLTPWALEDLRRIVRHERFSRDALVSRARQGRVGSVLWVVADWMAENHSAREWREIRDLVGLHPPSERSRLVYAVWRQRGQPPKPGLFVVASSGDNVWRCAVGLAHAVTGAIQGRALRLLAGKSARQS